MQLLAGAAIIGSNGLLVRLAGTAPTTSAFWRMLLAGLLLAVFVQLRGGWQPLSRQAWLWLLLPSLAFAADLWMWHRSILIVGPGLSTLLANTQVFFMALAGLLLFGERLGARFIAGVGLAFFGLWLLLGGDWAELPAQYRWGVWLGLGTGLAYAAYNIGLKRSQAVAALRSGKPAIEQVLCLSALGSAIALALLAGLDGSDLRIPSLRALGILLVLAGIGHCLSWVLISRSMVQLPVALVGLLLLLQPTVAYLLDVLVLDLQPTARQWTGLAVTLLGIFIASVRTRPGRKAAA